jgi:hypothetical protein
MPRQRYERLQIMLSAQELGALDDFRFRHRMPSRAAAIRELLRRGLAGDEPVRAGRSIDFGVLDQGKITRGLRRSARSKQ